MSQGQSTVNADSTLAIQATDLTKLYDRFLAVDRASFDVRQGEIFGFLGPNGAGKTTTINMLTGLAKPSAGTVRIFGNDRTRDIKKAQHLMGIVPDESNLYPELDGFDNLCFCAALYGMRKEKRESEARKLLEMFGLADAGKKKFAQYSKGMKRKLTVAAGIVHSPRILFLDEPTTGIDVASARQIRQLIAQLSRAGSTIFLTTHYIEEAERLCDRIAFIVQGKIVTVDTVQNLMRDFQDKQIIQFALGRPAAELVEPLQEAFPAVECEIMAAGALQIHSKDEVDLVPFIRFFEEHRVEVSEARKVQPSLEDVFVRITGLEIEVMKKENEKGKGDPAS